MSTSSLKYQQLAERFRSQVETGVLKPGDRLPSLKEMYSDEGISRPTVEKAYTLLEREGLIERQHGAGVFVRETTPDNGLESKSTRRAAQDIIGICGDGFGSAGYSTYWSHLLGGAREAATRAGMQLLILDAKTHQGWEKADGVLVCDWNDARKPRKNLPGMPMVSLLTAIPGVASAVADDEGGVREATEYLIGQGHRCIGYLHTYPDHAVVQNRLKGYSSALKNAGIKPKQEWGRCLRGHYEVGKRFTTEARKNMLLWLRDDWRKLGMTALLCHNDETAVGVIAALREAGVRVPEDVSVVGFDGTEYCDLVTPRISSVEVPLREIGAAGVELLLQQIKQESKTKLHTVVPAKFVARETTCMKS